MVLGDGARKLVDGGNPAVLATVNPDGSPQTSVVWVGRDGNDVVISTQAGRRKDANLRREPRASLLVIAKDNPDEYVEIRGTATVSEDVGRTVAVQLAEACEGEGAGDEYLALPPDVVRTVIRITPTRLTGPRRLITPSRRQGSAAWRTSPTVRLQQPTQHKHRRQQPVDLSPRSPTYPRAPRSPRPTAHCRL
jgi:PPOX class probable F420-dependent enzyme